MRIRPTTFHAAMWATTIVVIVGAIVGVAWWLQQRSDNSGPAAKQTDTAAQRVIVDRDYYVFVRLVEFKPRMPDGEAWDTGGSAPDAKVELRWHGNLIFSLPTRENQFISTWDLFRVNVTGLVLGNDLDLASVLNGPIVRITPGQPLTVGVWDNDVGPSDLALNLDIPLAELHEGINHIELPADAGLLRLRIDLLSTSMGAQDLIKWQSNGL